MAWRIEIDKDVQRSMKKLDKQIAVEVHAHAPAPAAVGILARTLEHAPSRLHRVGDALNLVGQALKTNPDHGNLLAF